MNNSLKVRVEKKPFFCIVCGSANIAEYLYGYPLYTPQLQKKMDEGIIVLGGCVLTNDDPIYLCNNCKKKYYRKK